MKNMEKGFNELCEKLTKQVDNHYDNYYQNQFKRLDLENARRTKDEDGIINITFTGDKNIHYIFGSSNPNFEFAFCVDNIPDKAHVRFKDINGNTLAEIETDEETEDNKHMVILYYNDGENKNYTAISCNCNSPIIASSRISRGVRP